MMRDPIVQRLKDEFDVLLKTHVEMLAARLVACVEELVADPDSLTRRILAEAGAINKAEAEARRVSLN